MAGWIVSRPTHDGARPTDTGTAGRASISARIRHSARARTYRTRTNPLRRLTSPDLTPSLNLNPETWTMEEGGTRNGYPPTFSPRFFPIAALGLVLYLLVKAWEYAT